MPYTGLGIWSRLSHLLTQSRNVPLTEAEISSMVAKTKIAEISVAGPLVLMETQNPSQHSQVVKVPDFDHLHKNVRVWRSMGTTPKSWFHKGKSSPNCHPAWWTISILTVLEVGPLLATCKMGVLSNMLCTQYWHYQSAKVQWWAHIIQHARHIYRNTTCR